MTHPVAAYLEACQSRINQLLDTLPLSPGAEDVPALATLREAARYALCNGGKRVRPVLAYAAAEAIDPALGREALDQPALALELIHTYSLIHDDLPAMDDDDLRRGKPSLHRAYDEATAILVGDGLQALAFSLLAGAPLLHSGQRLDMIAEVAAAAGPAGMVGGQYIDVQATSTAPDSASLGQMHGLKTGALIRAALSVGAIAAGGDARQRTALQAYGGSIGLAFQVVDDVLDVTGDAALIGKTRGKDSDANKPTYVSLLGLDGARAEAGRLLDEALGALAPFDAAADPLRHLAHYIVERDR